MNYIYYIPENEIKVGILGWTLLFDHQSIDYRKEVDTNRL